MNSITTTTITITITTIIIIIITTTTTTVNSSSSNNSRAWSVVMRPIDYDACFWLAASSTLSTLMEYFLQQLLCIDQGKMSSCFFLMLACFFLAIPLGYCSQQHPKSLHSEFEKKGRIVGFSVGECWFLDEQIDHQHLLLKQSSSLCNAMQMCNMNECSLGQAEDCWIVVVVVLDEEAHCRLDRHRHFNHRHV
ncbi:hypothetical protein T10_3966 [Trichinella papuae]|uniref:Uncharacterized protein n=1 Tax=Trichinella papuae TaxID=268474 RepID=A0A0V1MZE0_9BILA|nr:hypothetical protein T10_3966 [Trichinella papuae]